MPYSLTLPDGSLFPGIPDDVPEGQARSRAEQMYPDAFANRPEMTRNPGSTAVSGFGSGLAALRGQLGTFWSGITGAPDEEIRAGAERTQAATEQHAPHPTIHSMVEGYNQSPDLLSGLGSVASQVPGYITGTIAENLPGMSLPAIGGWIGGRALPAIAAGARIAPHPLIKAAGYGLGAALTAFPQFFGGNLEEQATQAPHNQPIDRGTAALAATGQAALDPVILAVMGAFGRNEARAAMGSLIQGGAQGFARATALGMPSMVAQTVMGRAQAGLDLLSDEALDQYREAVGTGLVMAGTLGTHHGVTEERGAQARDAQRLADAEAVRQGAQTTAEVQRAQDQETQRNADLARAQTSISDAADEQAQQRALALTDQREPGGEQRLLTQLTDEQGTPRVPYEGQGFTAESDNQRTPAGLDVHPRQDETPEAYRARLAGVANVDVQGPVQVVPDVNGWRLRNDQGQLLGKPYSNAETAGDYARIMNDRVTRARAEAEAAKGRADEPAATLRAAQQATTAPQIKLADLPDAIQQAIRTQRLREGHPEIDAPTTLTDLRNRGVDPQIVNALEAKLRPDVAGTQQGVPAFVTRQQRVRLADLGYTPEQIHAMPPEEVHRRLGAQEGPPEAPKPLPEGTFTEDQYNAAVAAVQGKGRVDVGLIRKAIGGGPMERARNVREVMASRGVLDKTGEGGNPTYRLAKPSPKVELRGSMQGQDAYDAARAAEQAQAADLARAQPQGAHVERIAEDATQTRDDPRAQGYRAVPGIAVERAPRAAGSQAPDPMAGGVRPELTRVPAFVEGLRKQIRDAQQQLRSVPKDAPERPRLERRMADLQRRHDFAIEQAWRKRGTPDPRLAAERTMKAEHNAVIDQIHESLKKRLADLGLKPDQVKTFLKHMGDPSKEGHSLNRMIDLSIDIAGGIRNPEIVSRVGEVMNHEIIHTLKDLGLINEREWNALVREAKRTIHPDKAANGATFRESAEKRYSEERWTSADRDEEAVAEMFRYWARDGRLTPKARTVFQKVVEFFKRVGDVLRGRGYTSAEHVMRDINEGRVGARREGSAAAMRVGENKGRPAHDEHLADAVAREATNPARESRVVDPKTEMTLKPTKGPPGWEDVTWHNIVDPDGRVWGHVGTTTKDGKAVEIEYITAVGKTMRERANAFGPSVVRNIGRALRKLYPDAENFTGTRISGARVAGEAPSHERISIAARMSRGLEQPDEGLARATPEPPPRDSAELVERYARNIKRAPMTPSEQASFDSVFGKRPVSDPPLRGVAKFIAAFPSWFRFNYVDQGNAIDKQTRAEAQMNRGGVMPRADVSAIAAYNMAKRFQSFVQHMIEHGGSMSIMRDPNMPGSSWVKITGNHRSLKDMFRPLVNSPHGNLENKAQMYMAAVRGVSLDAQGREQPISAQAIRDGLAFGNQHPEIKEFAREYQAFNRELMKFAVDTGVIDAATAREWTRHGDYYPFYREMDKDGMPTIRGQRAAGIGSKLKIHELKGGATPPMLHEDMIGNILQNVSFWTKAGLDNLAAAKAAEVGRATGIVTDVIPRQASKDGGSFFYRENGKARQVYTDDKQFVGAMRGLELDVVPTWLRWLGFPAKLLREMVTRDPVFMLGSNLVRDTGSAFAINRNFRYPVIGTLKGMYDYARGSTSSHALLAMGGGGGYDFMRSQGMTSADKLRRNITDRSGIHRIGTPAQLMSLLRRAWDATGKVGEASDMSTRISIYDGAMAKTGSEAQASYEAIMSMPFHRHGASEIGRVLTTLIPFLNARLQGLDVLWHGGLKDTMRIPGQMVGMKMTGDQFKNAARFMLRGTMLTGVALAAKALAQNEPDYAHIDDYIKDGNVLVPARALGLGDSGFFSIMKPFEVGALFMTVPEHIIDYMAGREDGPRMARAFLNQAAAIIGTPTLPNTPIPMPQFLAPLAEISANQSSFTGRPITPRAEQDLPPEQQYDSRTSAVARLMGNVPMVFDTVTGQWHGVSPRTWDHLLQGYGGTIGGYILGASTYLINSMRGDQPVRPAQSISELPGIRRFFRTADNSTVREVSEFYDLLHAATQDQRSMNRMTALGDMEGAMRLQQQSGALMAQGPALTQIGHVMTQLRQYENVVRNDPSMSPEQKQQALRQIRDMRIMATQNIDQMRRQSLN